MPSKSCVSRRGRVIAGDRSGRTRLRQWRPARGRDRIRPFARACAIALPLLLSSLAGAGDGAAQERRFISIGTGGTTGVYFAAGNAICRMLHEEAYPGVDEERPLTLRCASPGTEGSTANLAEIAAGNLEFGIVQSDWHYHAYHGTAPDRVAALPALRSVFSLYAEPLHLVAAADAPIARFADLKGARVNIGNPGSGHRQTMLFLLQAHGMGPADLGQVRELDVMAQSQALCEGEIDAFGILVGVPSAAVALATDGCGARVIPLDGPVEERIIAERPYYVRATIPAGSYETTDRDVATFGVTATLVTRADVDADVVYEVTRAVMDNLATLRLLHPAFDQLRAQDMISQGLSAPLHPGALRYYRARGWM
jgi:TRAP transporter TAXI family solute receptor